MFDLTMDTGVFLHGLYVKTINIVTHKSTGCVYLCHILRQRRENEPTGVHYSWRFYWLNWLPMDDVEYDTEADAHKALADGDVPHVVPPMGKKEESEGDGK